MKFSQLTVRDLIWGTVVVALLASFLISRAELRMWKGRAHACQAILEQLGFEVVWHADTNSVTYGRDGGPWGGMSIPAETGE